MEENSWSVKIIGFYKSLANITWEDIPDFAVLTGPNGSGKSQFLQAVDRGLGYKDNYIKRELNFISITNNIDNMMGSNNPRLPIFQRQYEAEKKFFDSNFYTDIKINNSSLEDENEVVLIENAYQEKPRSNFNSDRLLKKIDESFKKSEGLKPAEKVGRVVDIRSPISDLSLAMHVYRVEDFKAYESKKYNNEEYTLPPPPWEILNKLFAEAGFDLEVISPSRTGIDKIEPVRFFSKGKEVGAEDLSSGELTIVSLIISLFSCRNGAVLPKVLLLDELDAHLHPSLTSQVLNSIKSTLVEDLDIKVIMATHSPSTVALSNDSEIFAIENNEIKQVNKWTAVSMLTSGIVSIGPQTKFVFVEDHDDVEFYNTIVDVLEKIDPGFPKGRLAFLPSNKDITEKSGGGGCTRVVRWTASLDTPAIAGLIDLDQDAPIEGEVANRIWKLDRYSIENFLLDPLLLATYLSRNRDKPLDSFDKYVGSEGMLRSSEAESLQGVVDEVISSFESHLDAGVDLSRIDVEYAKGPKITLPKWLFEERGKDLIGLVQDGLGCPFVMKKQIEMIRITELVPAKLATLLKEIAES